MLKVLSAGNARSSQATEAYINNVHKFQWSWSESRHHLGWSSGLFGRLR